MNYQDLEKTQGPTALQKIFGNKLKTNIPNNNNYDYSLQNNCLFKIIQLYYESEYVQEVKIDKSESFEELRRKFKSILYKLGKVSYRPAFPNEIILREKPHETLEYLINRGVIDPEPSISFCVKDTLKHYPPICYDFKQIKEGDRLEVKYENKVMGSGGLCSIEFVDVDELSKVKVLQFNKKAPDWRKITIGLNLFGKCLNKNC